MTHKITRKQFLLSNATLPAVALGVFAASCGDDEDPGSVSGNEDACDSNVAVVNQHTHTVIIARDAVEAGDATTLTLSAASGHTHRLALTANDMADLAQGDTLTLTSSSDAGHTHSVRVSC
jgi:hypothetical protein